MSKIVICLAVLVQLAAALYYKPRPLVCPVSQTVQYQDEWLKVTEIEVLQVPFPINQVNLNTMFRTRVVAVASVTFQTVTAPALQLVMTDVQLVEVTEPLTVIRVDTVTSILVDTLVDILTSTATNYLTVIQILPVLETFHVTVTEVETRSAQVTQTVPETVFSSVTVTKAQLQTKVVIQYVPVSTIDLTTEVEERQVTRTHSLTMMITSTICPPPGDIYN